MKVEGNRVSWLLLIVLLTFSSCYDVTVKVNNIPNNTPPGSRIYITGNFNNWDPGDPNFMLTMDEDSTYSVKLPKGVGKIEYKFTRGDWTSQETDACGYLITNHIFQYGITDTLYHIVESWKDLEAENCSQITFVIDSIPPNTPTDDAIAIAGNFNRWNPEKEIFVAKKDSSGRQVITVPREGKRREIEYKFTRGNLSSVEADEFGNEVLVRRTRFGEKDTVFVEIKNWADLAQAEHNSVRIIIDRIPEDTPKDDNIYIVGSFNDWYPGDNDYIMKKNKNNKYEITIPRKSNEIEFKFTRGDWSKEEADKYGYKLNNRNFTFGEKDTLHVSIDNWYDLADIQLQKVILIVRSLPESTPEDAKIYAAGTFNNWKPGKRKYRFEKNKQGKYELEISRDGHYFEFKMTRGSWETQEVDSIGNYVEDRRYEFRNLDTLFIDVFEWYDTWRPQYNQVCIIIDKLPLNTPKRDNLYIAGDFNNWDPGNDDYILMKNKEGKYQIEIPAIRRSIEFKITRGSWIRVETNEEGLEIKNRRFSFTDDTLRISVKTWRDFTERY